MPDPPADPRDTERKRETQSWLWVIVGASIGGIVAGIYGIQPAYITGAIAGMLGAVLGALAGAAWNRPWPLPGRILAALAIFAVGFGIMFVGGGILTTVQLFLPAAEQNLRQQGP